MRTLSGPGNPRSTLSADVHAVLQLWAIDEPLFPNLKSLELWSTVGEFIPFIPLFLSPRTTSISITFTVRPPTEAMSPALLVATFPTLCPKLQTIRLRFLSRDPTITATVSKLLLTTNRDALRQFRVDSPLTEEAREVIYKLPELCGLTTVVEGSTSLPIMVLPNLTEMNIEYDHNCDWLEGFRGATLGKLDSVTFRARSESARVAGFLEAFEDAGRATSTTLSAFRFYTRRPWRPNYRSLLSFKQLKVLEIGFSCEGGCSSTIDDDIITDLARAMPKLETLRLGGTPCETPAGVTVEGLAVLAHHCTDLSYLSIHFRVDSFYVLPVIGGTPHAGNVAPRRDCALTDLSVGRIPMPEESVLIAALTLVRIFPNLSGISHKYNSNWGKISSAICLSGQIVDRSSKEHSLSTSRSNLGDTSPGTRLENSS